ncbi:hypothetical protein ASAP_0887 [Asaia bogorensis]|uniref:Uncharacterized protein n=3 Tax=Asaia TaxID=91914 RepID=A0A060QJH2_9PROT|nr:hypothetical protein ASAP_0887 [Asaia bogorensis]
MTQIFSRDAQRMHHHVPRKAATSLKEELLKVPFYFSLRELPKTLRAGLPYGAGMALVFLLLVPGLIFVLLAPVITYLILTQSSADLVNALQPLMHHLSQARLIGFFDTARTEIYRSLGDILFVFMTSNIACGLVARLIEDRSAEEMADITGTATMPS